MVWTFLTLGVALIALIEGVCVARYVRLLDQVTVELIAANRKLHPVHRRRPFNWTQKRRAAQSERMKAVWAQRKAQQ